MLLHGACHCGNLALRLEWPSEPLLVPARACGCSFCMKHGAVWTSRRDAALTVTVDSAAMVTRYSFGTRTATFHVCGRCGVVPIVTSEIEGQLYAVVNVNALQGLDESSLRRSLADFDGEALEARLARRRRNWIGAVTFEGFEA
jgi:hypothetical protein